jgi:ketosteroid isomerase-like protein
MKYAHYKRGIFLLLAVAVLAACAQQPAQPPAPPDTRAADEAAIKTAAADWGKAAAAKDLDKTLSYYADDASMYPPNMPIATGPEARRKVWSELLATPGMTLSVTTTKVEAARSGDVAYETGTFQESFKDKKGKALNVTGKYVVVWKKQTSGQWKAIADIFNIDQ